jgi:DNA-binding NtrC family response regulator
MFHYRRLRLPQRPRPIQTQLPADRRGLLPLRLPPLRERPQDIALLAGHFILRYSELNGVDAKPLSAGAMDKLVRHTWRGNVRELENTLHRAVLIAQGDEIGSEAIMLTTSTNDTAEDGVGGGSVLGLAGSSAAGAGRLTGMVGRTVSDVERDLIIDTLTHCVGNRTHAATILGISIRTLRNKLKLYSDATLVSLVS